MTTTEPRLKTGGKMHRIGTEAYVVVLDAGAVDREVSDRHPGNAWIAVGPGDGIFRCELLFVDDIGDGNWSTFELNRWADSAYVGLFIDGELVYKLGTDGRTAYYPNLPKRSTIRVDWSGAFDRMV